MPSFDLKRELKTFVGIVLGVMASLFVVAQTWREPWADAVDATLFNLVVTICFTVVAQALALGLAGRRASPARTLASAAFAVVVGGELAVQTASLIWHAAPGSFRTEVFSMGLVVMGVVVVISLFSDRAELAVEVARLRVVELELALLRARVRPHFLFNSLNSVASLIPDEPHRAERAVEDLACLLRYVLEASDAETVPLGAELDGVAAYLALQKLRYEERLECTIDVAADLRELPVPALLLQPLVENAVMHGMGRQRGPMRIEIHADLHGEELRIRVMDDGNGAESHPGTGTALRDLRRRLALREPPGTMETWPLPGGGYQATVALPGATVVGG